MGLIIYVDDDFDYKWFTVFLNNTGCKNIFIKVYDKN